jgi:hypothetical protein
MLSGFHDQIDYRQSFKRNFLAKQFFAHLMNTLKDHLAYASRRKLSTPLVNKISKMNQYIKDSKAKHGIAIGSAVFATGMLFLIIDMATSGGFMTQIGQAAYYTTVGVTASAGALLTTTLGWSAYKADCCKKPENGGFQEIIDNELFNALVETMGPLIHPFDEPLHTHFVKLGELLEDIIESHWGFISSADLRFEISTLQANPEIMLVGMLNDESIEPASFKVPSEQIENDFNRDASIRQSYSVFLTVGLNFLLNELIAFNIEELPKMMKKNSRFSTDVTRDVSSTASIDSVLLPDNIQIVVEESAQRDTANSSSNYVAYGSFYTPSTYSAASTCARVEQASSAPAAEPQIEIDNEEKPLLSTK